MNVRSITRISALACLLVFSMSGWSKGAVTFEDLGSDPITGRDIARINFSTIVFESMTGNSNGGIGYILFENFFGAASTANGSGGSGSFSIRVNHGTPVSRVQNLNSPSRSGQHVTPSIEIDNNDLALFIVGINFSVGDRVEISGLDLTYTTPAGQLNTTITTAPTVSARFTTATGFGYAPSANAGAVTVIPEPSSGLLLLGGLFLAGRRSRQ